MCGHQRERESEGGKKWCGGRWGREREKEKKKEGKEKLKIKEEREMLKKKGRQTGLESV